MGRLDLVLLLLWLDLVEFEIVCGSCNLVGEYHCSCMGLGLWAAGMYGMLIVLDSLRRRRVGYGSVVGSYMLVMRHRFHIVDFDNRMTEVDAALEIDFDSGQVVHSMAAAHCFLDNHMDWHGHEIDSYLLLLDVSSIDLGLALGLARKYCCSLAAVHSTRSLCCSMCLQPCSRR